MTSTIYFPYNARRAFTAAKWAVQRAGLFNRINADERLLRITASHGFPIVSEDIELRIVASSTDEASVEIKSSDKLLYNIFKWGNNKRNVKDIMALIQNEIYRYLQVDDSACYGRRKSIMILRSNRYGTKFSRIAVWHFTLIRRWSIVLKKLTGGKTPLHTKDKDLQ